MKHPCWAILRVYNLIIELFQQPAGRKILLDSADWKGGQYPDSPPPSASWIREKICCFCNGNATKTQLQKRERERDFVSSREGEEDKLSFLKGERYIDISEKRGGEMDNKATGKWLPPTPTRVNSFLFWILIHFLEWNTRTNRWKLKLDLIFSKLNKKSLAYLVLFDVKTGLLWQRDLY